VQITVLIYEHQPFQPVFMPSESQGFKMPRGQPANGNINAGSLTQHRECSVCCRSPPYAENPKLLKSLGYPLATAFITFENEDR
jgi:hypothetical protein